MQFYVSDGCAHLGLCVSVCCSTMADYQSVSIQHAGGNEAQEDDRDTAPGGSATFLKSNVVCAD